MIHKIRKDLRVWKPYSSARSLIENKKNFILLDANENPFGTWNRYPDPFQMELKKQISKIKKVPVENIFLGNGSDEVLDLCMRLLAEPDKDSMLICPPTYGMYEVLARLNRIRILSVPLKADTFQMDVKAIFKVIRKERPTFMVLCSPNNPTGNTLNDIEKILKNYDGWVIIDEAYVDFSNHSSWIHRLNTFPNLIVVQTLSKAWGMAGLRIGMAFAHPSLVQMLTAIKPPYNIGSVSIKTALQLLNRKNREIIRKSRKIILKERDAMFAFLSNFPLVKKVFPSDANFILVQSDYAKSWQEYLKEKQIMVRDRSSLVPQTFRISVGTPAENKKFIKYSKNFLKSALD